MDRSRALEQQAIALAKRGDFGAEALSVNQELVSLDATNTDGWTRLARCRLVAGSIDAAADAVERALTLNPSNQVARGLRREIIRTRTFGLPAHATLGLPANEVTGFGPAQFEILCQLPPKDAAKLLTDRFESLFSFINEEPVARRIVSIRAARGSTGSKLFRANSFYPADYRHIFAYNFGGRWEPQFNLAMSSGIAPYENNFRIGLGFNASLSGRTRNPQNDRERLVRYFENFQRGLAGPWGRYLRDWMAANGGFLQHGGNPLALDWTPDRAVKWMVDCNVLVHKWVFVGRWLFLDRDTDRVLLQSTRALAKTVGQVFSDLLPLWEVALKDES